MDIKTQFDTILKQYGHRVIYRRYSTGVKSSHYDPITREGVGGARWAHQDKVILTRDSQTSSSSSGHGQYDGTMVYYIKVEDSPKVNDCIIEVNSVQDAGDLEILNASHKHILMIKDIDPKRGADGRIVFYQCYVKPEYGHY
ncbi:hypothetical protein [Acinetobacter sp.]|uniref:hypothetical protein n=1 Tax=Acinetobacter sp. TaxID=472 RepID=UPI003D01B526